MRHAGAIVLGVGLAACAASPSAPTVDPTASRGAARDEAAREATIRDGEARVLELLAATDPRFAARVGGAKEARLHAAAIKALSEGDSDAAIEDGAIDFFSFTARARSIGEAEAVVAGLPAIDGGASAKMERELLVRLVAEERARLDEERALPRGASALVRGLIETWGAPATRPAAETHDARVARRLEEVRVSLQGGDLSRVRLAELDDSLDPLERIATPDLYGKTVQAIARLRLTLGDTTTHAQEDDASWPRLRASLHAHLGVEWSADELRSRLLTAEHTLRVRATAQTAHAHTDEHERDVADGWTVRAAPCAPFGGASPLRALPPPPERAPICGAIHAATEATGTASVVALHDDTVLALWALALHEAHATPNHATETAHLFFGTQPDREAHMLRYAAARPVAAIAAGLAASELATNPDADFAARWLTFGDAPLDIALGALGPREAEAPPTSPPPEPASLRP